MIIKLLMMIVLVAETSFCNAQAFVSESEAVTVASKYMQFYFDERTFVADNVDSIKQYRRNDHTLLYEVSYRNGNSVLVSGIKNIIPVLGYNESEEITSFFDIDEEMGLYYFIDKFATSIENIINRQSDTIIEQWTIILNDSISFYYQNNRSKYGPLLTSKWGQNYSNCGSDPNAYNYYVTETDDNCTYDYCPVGCVAVAMGQIMNYWKYPVYISNRSEQYDWCNMTDVLDADNENYLQERNAVSKLLRDCGVYTNTYYCVFNDCQSFAFPKNAKDVFVTRFRYSNNADLVRRYLNLRKWKNMIKSNVMAGLPVFYAAMEEDLTNGGHAFVCDGYNDNTGLYHFNWGWSGSGTWVSIDDIDSGSENWNILERAIIDLYPATNQDYCNYTINLSSHYNSYYNTYGYTFPQPYENVPQTATVLRSVPNSNSYPASWRTIPAGTTSEYVAHEEVLLQDGFVAEEGSDFYVHIIPCTLCDNDRTIVTSNNNLSDYDNETKLNYHEMVKDYYENDAEKRNGVPNPSAINIYPNPANDNITIEFTADYNSIEIYDSFGRKTMSRQVNTTTGQQVIDVDISGYPSGLYLVVVKNDTDRYYKRIVKN